MKFFSSLLFLTFAFASIANIAPKPIPYKINPTESKVEWFASKVTGKHNGTVGVKSGTLEFEGEKLMAGKFEIDMTTLAVTDLQGEWGAKLLGHLKSDDFFSVEKFNSATLVVKNAALLSAGVYTVTADMTIKGITKEVVFNALVNQSGGTATADIKLDRTDFDIRYGSGKFFPNIGDKMIHDEFNLKVNLAFGKAL